MERREKVRRGEMIERGKEGERERKKIIVWFGRHLDRQNQLLKYRRIETIK